MGSKEQSPTKSKGFFSLFGSKSSKEPRSVVESPTKNSIPNDSAASKNAGTKSSTIPVTDKALNIQAVPVAANQPDLNINLVQSPGTNEAPVTTSDSEPAILPKKVPRKAVGLGQSKKDSAQDPAGDKFAASTLNSGAISESGSKIDKSVVPNDSAKSGLSNVFPISASPSQDQFQVRESIKKESIDTQGKSTVVTEPPLPVKIVQSNIPPASSYNIDQNETKEQPSLKESLPSSPKKGFSLVNGSTESVPHVGMAPVLSKTESKGAIYTTTESSIAEGKSKIPPKVAPKSASLQAEKVLRTGLSSQEILLRADEAKNINNDTHGHSNENMVKDILSNLNQLESVMSSEKNFDDEKVKKKSRKPKLPDASDQVVDKPLEKMRNGINPTDSTETQSTQTPEFKVKKARKPKNLEPEISGNTASSETDKIEITEARPVEEKTKKAKKPKETADESTKSMGNPTATISESVEGTEAWPTEEKIKKVRKPKRVEEENSIAKNTDMPATAGKENVDTMEVCPTESDKVKKVRRPKASVESSTAKGISDKTATENADATEAWPTENTTKISRKPKANEGENSMDNNEITKTADAMDKAAAETKPKKIKKVKQAEGDSGAAVQEIPSEEKPKKIKKAKIPEEKTDSAGSFDEKIPKPKKSNSVEASAIAENNEERVSTSSRRVRKTISEGDSGEKAVRRSKTSRPPTLPENSLLNEMEDFPSEKKQNMGSDEFDTLGFPTGGEVSRPPMSMRTSVTDGQRTSAVGRVRAGSTATTGGRVRSSSTASTRPFDGATADTLLMQLRSAATAEVSPTKSTTPTERSRSTSISNQQRPSFGVGVQPVAQNIPNLSQIAAIAEQKNLAVNRPGQAAAAQQRRLQQLSSLGKAGGKMMTGQIKRSSVFSSDSAAVSAFANSSFAQFETSKPEKGNRTKFGAEFFAEVLKDGPHLITGFKDGLFQLPTGWDTKGTVF